jgi:hypothetical protein
MLNEPDCYSDTSPVQVNTLAKGTRLVRNEKRGKPTTTTFYECLRNNNGRNTSEKQRAPESVDLQAA